MRIWRAQLVLSWLNFFAALAIARYPPKWSREWRGNYLKCGQLYLNDVRKKASGSYILETRNVANITKWPNGV